MIRFVAIASIMRGAIEPAEVIDDRDNQAALSRLEYDGFGLYSEIVLWRKGHPYVASRFGRKLPAVEKLPRISPDLRAELNGAAVLMNEKHIRTKERMRSRG